MKKITHSGGISVKNIIHYAQEALDTFSERPLCDVDSLILSCVAYLDIPEELAAAHSWRGLPLRELFRAEHFDRLFSVTFSPDRTRELLTALAASPRFRDVRVMGYTAALDTTREKQFSAMTFRLGDRTSYVAFRGTDSTLVGWKEDFNMAFQSPVPSQEESTRYLTAAGRHCPGRIYVGGHSKGGNLAVYAAAFCKDSLQLRIQRAFSHDGPGFLHHVLGSPGFHAIAPRIEKTLPQSSVVGMLLEHQESAKIIKSRSVSLLQHDPFTWEVQEGAFVVVEHLTSDARFVDRTLSAWLEKMAPDQRERIVDALFGILSTCDISDLDQLRADWQKSLPAVAREAAALDADTREFLRRALKELAVLSVKTIPEMLREKASKKDP